MYILATVDEATGNFRNIYLDRTYRVTKDIEKAREFEALADAFKAAVTVANNSAIYAIPIQKNLLKEYYINNPGIYVYSSKQDCEIEALRALKSDTTTLNIYRRCISQIVCESNPTLVTQITRLDG